MRKLWRRLVFALTPQHKRAWELQRYSIARGSWYPISYGNQRSIEFMAFKAHRFGVAHRVVRIK